MTDNYENIDPNEKRCMKRKIYKKPEFSKNEENDDRVNLDYEDDDDYEKFTEEDLQKELSQNDQENDTTVSSKEIDDKADDSDQSQTISANNPIKECGYLVGEEEVTPREKMPNWLVEDPYDNTKYNLRTTKFKYRRFSGELFNWLTDQDKDDTIISSDWMTFSKRLTRLLKRYRDILSLFYRHGMSPVDRRDFLVGLLFAFPRLEERYDEFREIEGSKDPKNIGFITGVTKTSLKKTRLTDLMMDRFGKQFSRENRLEKKARKAAGIPTPIKTKHAKFGTSLAMSERNRKK